MAYLDADTVVVRNIDDMFLCDGFCGVMRHSERLNTGVLVLEVRVPPCSAHFVTSTGSLSPDSSAKLVSVFVRPGVARGLEFRGAAQGFEARSCAAPVQSWPGYVRALMLACKPPASNWKKLGVAKWRGRLRADSSDCRWLGAAPRG